MLKAYAPVLSFFIFFGIGILVASPEYNRLEEKKQRLEMVNTWTDSLEILISEPTGPDAKLVNFLLIKNL